MVQAIPPNVPASLAPLLRRDGEWLRCGEPGCGDRAFWAVWRPADFLRVKVGAHRAKVHAGRPQRQQAGRPQRRNVAAPAGLNVVAQGGVLVNLDGLARLQGERLGQGIARQGFAMAGTVRKVARPGQSRHNLAEWQSYLAAPAHIREWLAEPIMMAEDGSWLIVRRAEGVGAMAHADRKRVRDAIGQWCGDLHEFNVGYVDGHPVAIDYADGFNGRPLSWRGAVAPQPAPAAAGRAVDAQCPCGHWHARTCQGCGVNPLVAA